MIIFDIIFEHILFLDTFVYVILVLIVRSINFNLIYLILLFIIVKSKKYIITIICLTNTLFNQNFLNILILISLI